MHNTSAASVECPKLCLLTFISLFVMSILLYTLEHIMFDALFPGVC